MCVTTGSIASGVSGCMNMNNCNCMCVRAFERAFQRDQISDWPMDCPIRCTQLAGLISFISTIYWTELEDWCLSVLSVRVCSVYITVLLRTRHSYGRLRELVAVESYPSGCLPNQLFT